MRTRKETKLELARIEVAQERVNVRKGKCRVEAVKQAQEILQQLAKHVQQQTHNQVATVVSKCLEAVFAEPYEFHILFEQKRGKTEARLVFERDGQQYDPLSATGGGVVDLASFALRIAALTCRKPRQRPLLILDEPFRFVSVGYREQVTQLIERLAESTGIQFIIVTHIADLQVGQVIDLRED